MGNPTIVTDSADTYNMEDLFLSYDLKMYTQLLSAQRWRSLAPVVYSKQGNKRVHGHLIKSWVTGGEAAFILPNSDNIPMLKMNPQQVTLDAHEVSFGLQLHEDNDILDYVQNDQPVDTLMLQEAINRVSIGIDKAMAVGFAGGPEFGLLNNPVVEANAILLKGDTAGISPAGFSDGSWVRTSLPGEAIASDLICTVHQIIEASEGLVFPDRIILPLREYLHCAKTKVDVGTSNTKTVLEEVINNLKFLGIDMQIKHWKHAKDVGQVNSNSASAQDLPRAMIYEMKKNCLQMIIASDIKRRDFDNNRRSWETIYHSRIFGGYILHAGKVRYLDGI